jgi:FkbM family methyltransferase
VDALIRIAGKYFFFELRLGLWMRLSRLLGRKPGFDPEAESPTAFFSVHGAKLHLDKTHPLPRYVDKHPFYDSALPTFARYLRALHQRPIVVIDVGANVGDTAAIIAAATTPQGVKLVCVEADASYLPLLRENVLDLDARIVFAIAGPSTGVSNHQAVANGLGTSVIEASNIEAQTVALDDLVENGIVDLLKIDTDGYEVEVLLGSTKILRGDAASVFLEYSPNHLRRYGKIEPGRVLDTMIAAGFSRVIVYDNLGYLIGLFPIQSDTLLALTEYATRRPKLYYDLLFHKNDAILESFMASEVVRMTRNVNADDRQ